MTFTEAVKIADNVLKEIKTDSHIGKFYMRGIHGTPLENDISIRMAQAFLNATKKVDGI